MGIEIHFLLLLAIFAVVYFAVSQPVFQVVSKRVRGRKFILRLGTPWQAGNPEHRWDVFMSVLSFVMALAISGFLLDLFFPLAKGA